MEKKQANHRSRLLLDENSEPLNLQEKKQKIRSKPRKPNMQLYVPPAKRNQNGPSSENISDASEQSEASTTASKTTKKEAKRAPKKPPSNFECLNSSPIRQSNLPFSKKAATVENVSTQQNQLKNNKAVKANKKTKQPENATMPVCSRDVHAICEMEEGNSSTVQIDKTEPNVNFPTCPKNTNSEPAKPLSQQFSDLCSNTNLLLKTSLDDLSANNLSVQSPKQRDNAQNLLAVDVVESSMVGCSFSLETYHDTENLQTPPQNAESCKKPAPKSIYDPASEANEPSSRCNRGPEICLVPEEEESVLSQNSFNDELDSEASFVSCSSGNAEIVETADEPKLRTAVDAECTKNFTDAKFGKIEGSDGECSALSGESSLDSLDSCIAANARDNKVESVVGDSTVGFDEASNSDKPNDCVERNEYTSKCDKKIELTAEQCCINSSVENLINCSLNIDSYELERAEPEENKVPQGTKENVCDVELHREPKRVNSLDDNKSKCDVPNSELNASRQDIEEARSATSKNGIDEISKTESPCVSTRDGAKDELNEAAARGHLAKGNEKQNQEVASEKKRASKKGHSSRLAAMDRAQSSKVVCAGGELESWDVLFDENGDCLKPDIMNELTSALGNVKVEKPGYDYYDFQPHDPDVSGETFGHIVEIYDFPAEFKTPDLLAAFSAFKNQGFAIKWVDDTHALGVFASPLVAADALDLQIPFIKVRPLSQAIRESKLKAKRCAEFLQPYKPRPETSAHLARRLVTGALGLRVNITKEQREQEKQQLREARERKKQAAKQKQDLWDGVITS